MIIGGASGNTTRNADSNFVRVTRDPNGTGELTTSGSSDVIRLERSNNAAAWVGSVTVVECMGSCDTSGFTLLDVEEVTVTGTGTQSSTGASSAWSDINQVVTFGGIRGGGVNVASGAASDDHCYGHGRVWPSGGSTVNVERNAAGCGSGGDSATYTVYVVEWGSEWNVQNVTVTGSAGGAAADSTNEYNTASISSVTRDNTWIWAAGYTADGGIGDSWAGQIATLGNGVAQNTTETTVAVGAEYADTRSVEVFVMEHADASVDYRFKSDSGSSDLNYNHTVDSKSGETYYTPPSVGAIGVTSQVAMDGSDGSWAVLFGNNPVAETINVAADEDDIGDTERSHTTEQVDYWVFDNSSDGDIRNSSGTIIGEYGVESSVGSSASSVSFSNTLSNPIVVATYNLDDASDEPSVVRLDNVSNTGFDVYMQVASASGSPAAGDVYWIALNSGAHTLPGSVSVEAGSVNLSTLNSDSDWSSTPMSQISPTNSYTSPIVLGQIQTVNDTSWQVFWSSDGNQANPPSGSSIYVGRHVGADSDTTRSAEDIGYVIIEDSTGTTDGVDWIATRSTDTVEGVDNSPPYAFSTGFGASAPSYTIGRFGLQYNSSNGTGNAFPRPYWGVRHTGSTAMKAFRQYSGQNWVAWIQSVDLSDVEQSAGALTVDIVDSGGSSVSSPSITMSPIVLTFETQTTTGTLGVNDERIRVNNTTANEQWSLSMAASGGPTNFWDGTISDYDFNDPTAQAGDGADTDSLGGQMSIDPSGATISPQGGCNTTGISLGSSSAFSEDVTNSITLASAGVSASTGCYWDFTDIDISQTIPVEQEPGSYTIDITLTVVAI